jgi:hypothetical protein
MGNSKNKAIYNSAKSDTMKSMMVLLIIKEEK